MRKSFAVCLLALCLLLCACGEGDGHEMGERVVYRLNEQKSFTTESVELDAEDDALETLVRALNTPAYAEGLQRVFPADVWIRGCTIQYGHARVEMTEPYLQLSPREQTLCDYAVTYTLMGLDEVIAVDILQGSRVLRYGLTADNAVLSDSGSGSGSCVVKLFLPDFEDPGLVSRSVVLELDGETELWELTARALLEELDCLPAGTQLRSISCEEGICTLSLSQELYTTEPELGYNARLIIGSFVNTLCHLTEVEQLIIRVGGEPIVSYGSYITFWPMSFDRSLMQ